VSPRKTPQTAPLDQAASPKIRHSSERRTALRIVIVEDAQALQLRKSAADLQAACPHAHFALAYRDTEVARAIFRDGQRQSALSRIGFLPMNFNIDL
jgi:hypothetical protein